MSPCRILLSVFLVFLVGFPSTQCIEYDKIVKIETTTAEDEESGMDLRSGSFIDLEVYGHYGELECTIYRLFHAETMGEGDFAPGQTDAFEGTDLQACDHEEVTWYPGSVSKVRVIHSGEDGWGVKSISVSFDDSSYLGCHTENGELAFVTGGEFVDLLC